MRGIRQVGVAVLLLVSYLTPAMACTVSRMDMNAEEHACCRAMQNHCEQMGTQASHGCCQKTALRSDNALDTKAITYHPVVVAAVWLTVSDWFHPAFVAAGRVEHPGYSPPQSSANSTSVLRI